MLESCSELQEMFKVVKGLKIHCASFTYNGWLQHSIDCFSTYTRIIYTTPLTNSVTVN
jgi:hypothetical protein